MVAREDDLERAAALADFLLLVRGDQERGHVQPLAHYAARFPGFALEIASEYEALLDRRAPRAPEVLAARGYRVLDELGRGGQGTVYLARDEELGRLVALKVLLAPLASKSRLMRLQRETTLLASLDHPGICAVYRAHLEDDPPFLVMRYVRGRTLAQLLASPRDADEYGAARPLACPPRNRAELARMLEFFEQAALALHVAHRAGIVHRDIKPANLVAAENGEPVLLDFGLARTLAEEDHGLTRTGEVLGSPAYMPPEQFDGGATEPDPRADVYALGVTLFECLTGRRPFEAPSQHQLERAIRFEPLPRASRWNPLTSAELDVVLATATEKERSKRYSTAMDFAEDLRRVRERHPIRARPASRGLRLRRWCQRNPSVATALVLIALSALGLLVATLLLLREQGRTEEALRVAESRNLAASALRDIDGNPRVALEEAIQAHSTFPGIHSRSALYSAIARQRIERVFPQYSERMTAQLVAGAMSADEGSWIQADKWGGLAVYRTSDAAPTWLGTATDPTALALAPDGAFAALGEEAGAVRWYDVASSRERVLTPHLGTVTALAFAPDGALASGGKDHRVRGYAPADLSAPAYDIELPFDIGGLRYSPSGEWLVAWPAEAVGAELHPVALIEARAGTVVAILAGHEQRIDEVAFSPSSAALATGADDCTVRVWELPSGTCRFTVVHPGKLHDLAFSPDGERLLTGFDPGDPTSSSASGAWVLSARDGSRQLDLRGHEFRAVVAVDWSADGTRVLTGSYDSTVRVWSAVDGSQLSCLRVPEPQDLVYHACFLDGGRRLFVRQRHGSMVARAETWDPAHRLGGHEAPVLHAVFSPDSQRIASADASGWVLVHDSRGAPLARLQIPGAQALAFVRDGQELLVSTRDGTVSRFRVADGSACMRARFGTEPVELRPIPGRDEFVCACGSRILRCDLEGRIEREYTGHAAAVTCLDLSPDGRRLASGGADRSARLFDLDSGRCEHVFDEWGDVAIRPSNCEEFDVGFDASGARLLRASDDGCIRCYSVSSGELLWRLGPVGRMGQVRWLTPELVLARPRWAGTPLLVTPHGAGEPTFERLAPPPSGLPTAMDVTPDGRLCLLSSTNGLTQLWDLRDRSPWADIGEDRSAVLCAAFSPDGTTLLTGQADGALSLWPVDVERAARLATPTVVPVPTPPAAMGR